MTRLFLTGIMAVLMASGAQAAVLNLTAPDASGLLNGAIFSRFSQAGQGSGNFEAFLRIQGNSNKSTTESGYNTDGTPQLDAKNGGFTHSIQLSEVPLVKIGGTNYRELVLDAADNGNLSLDTFELYLLDKGDITTYPFSESPRFSMGSGNSVLLSDINGNGVANMYAYVPETRFTGDSHTYLYLYSTFSQFDASFEEWGVKKQSLKKHHTSAVPEPGSMALLGIGLAGMGLLKRNRKQ